MKGVTVKIGVIEGSIRQGRNAAPVARWVLDNVPKQNDVEFVLLDLASFNLPLYDAPVPPLLANRQYDSEAVRAWSRAIDECDAFIFVSPEYNFGVPGVLKNAVDWLAKTAFMRLRDLLLLVGIGGMSYIAVLLALGLRWRQLQPG